MVAGSLDSEELGAYPYLLNACMVFSERNPSTTPLDHSFPRYHVTYFNFVRDNKFMFSNTGCSEFSSYEIELRKMTSHFDLMLKKF